MARIADWRRRHQIKRPRGAEWRIAVAAIDPPDAGPVHLHLAMDQSLLRRHALDVRLAAIAGAIGGTGPEFINRGRSAAVKRLDVIAS